MKQPPMFVTVDFDQSPFIVIWETTRACALRCVHCRAEAVDQRDPDELSTRAAFRLIDEIRRFGRPLVVLTGGDPMRRPDIKEIVSYGVRAGLRIAMTPSGTDRVTRDDLVDLKRRGLARLAVSLDGSTAAMHDAFRQVNGSFEWTTRIMRWANEIALPLQVNTTITRHNLGDLGAMLDSLGSFNIELWSVFFLVPIGRGKLADEITAAEYEDVLCRLAEASFTSPFDIKSTEAPHYRRVLIQKKKALPPRPAPRPGFWQRFLDRWRGARGPVGQGSAQRAGQVPPLTPALNPRFSGAGQARLARSAQGVNDGKGFVFVSHTGEIWPSGFLPISAGNVKRDSLVEVYRNSEIFTALRDETRLKGKCGACEFKRICGGSRARAFAVHGDMFAADPFCVYVPRGYRITEQEKVFW